jgi:hypothetical protein
MTTDGVDRAIDGGLNPLRTAVRRTARRPQQLPTTPQDSESPLHATTRAIPGQTRVEDVSVRRHDAWNDTRLVVCGHGLGLVRLTAPLNPLNISYEDSRLLSGLLIRQPR